MEDDMYDSTSSYASQDEADEDDYDFSSQDSEDDTPVTSKAATVDPEAEIERACAWTVIPKEGLAAAQDAALNDVMGILDCSKANARRLLITFRWDVGAIFADLAERGGEHMYARAGIPTMAPPTPKRDESGRSTRAKAKRAPCKVCFKEYAPDRLTTMDCGHTFCNDCWIQHFTFQIKQGNSRRLACMAHNCGVVCNEDKVMELVGWWDLGLTEAFNSKLLGSFVEDNKRVRWCTSVPHCGAAVKVDGELWVEPTCMCGWEFCFKCGQEPHSPATCQMWQAWKDESNHESLNWIRVNTKPCPKCGQSTEKNGGCNHMRCSQCDAHWCWKCCRNFDLATVSSHGCNMFKEDDTTIGMTDLARELERYLHYHERWQAHMSSVELETGQIKAISQKIAAMEATDEASGTADRVQDFTWLMRALDQLLAARKILGRSYVLAFYIFGRSTIPGTDFSACKPKQQLFEHAQQNLESEVERLSSLIASRVELLLGPHHLKVLDSTASIANRLRKLYEMIEADVLAALPTQHISPYKALANPIKV